MTNNDFAKASKNDAAPAAQNTAEPAHAEARKGSADASSDQSSKVSAHKKTPAKQADALENDYLLSGVFNKAMGDEGLEQSAKTRGKPALLTGGNAESDADVDGHVEIDADLASVVEAWARLPAAIRKAIVAMVRM